MPDLSSADAEYLKIHGRAIYENYYAISKSF